MWGDQSGEKGVGGCGSGDHGAGGRLLAEMDLRKLDCRCVGRDEVRCFRRRNASIIVVKINMGK